ncbi:hypothetical protein BDF19DRAFT_431079 [Syncephalis fuscata]|nr:hypothetical protein BDF19DRAFT_431079 [Syncephalis fuscata]
MQQQQPPPMQYHHPSMSAPQGHAMNGPPPPQPYVMSATSMTQNPHSMQHIPPHPPHPHHTYEQTSTPHPHRHMSQPPPHDYLIHSSTPMAPSSSSSHVVHPHSGEHRRPSGYGHPMTHSNSTPAPPTHPTHHAMMGPPHPHASSQQPPQQPHGYHYHVRPVGPPPPTASLPSGAGGPPPPQPPHTGGASTQSKELLNWIDQNANCVRPDERHYIGAFVMGDRSVPLPHDATVPIYQVVLREEQQQDMQTGAMFRVRVVLEMAIDTMRWRQLQMRTPCQ